MKMFNCPLFNFWHNFTVVFQVFEVCGDLILYLGAFGKMAPPAGVLCPVCRCQYGLAC